MLTQPCFTADTPQQQWANIAASVAGWAGDSFDPNCAVGQPDQALWAIYKAFSEEALAVTLNTIAAGTAYTLTNAFAALDFGTTDPVITFTRAGTYLLTADVQTALVGATFAAVQSVSFKLVRTNNTPADIGTARSAMLPIVTTATVAGPSVRVQFLYTASVGDIVTIQGLVSNAPSAGSITASAAQIIAQPQ